MGTRAVGSRQKRRLRTKLRITSRVACATPIGAKEEAVLSSINRKMPLPDGFTGREHRNHFTIGAAAFVPIFPQETEEESVQMVESIVQVRVAQILDDFDTSSPAHIKSKRVVSIDDEGTFSDDGIPLSARRRRKLPIHARKILGAWYDENRTIVYMTDKDKSDLVQATGLTGKQVSGWFSNRRKRDRRWQNREQSTPSGARQSKKRRRHRESKNVVKSLRF